MVVNNAFRAYSFDPRARTPCSARLAWQDYQAQFDGAVGARLHVCRAVLPHFRQRAQGSIVNIVSDLVERPVVPYHDYTTAKSALVGFSRNLAAELGPLGIRVNCVAPGLVYPTQASGATRAQFRESHRSPRRRCAASRGPRTSPGPVLFLASDWSGS